MLHAFYAFESLNAERSGRYTLKSEIREVVRFVDAVRHAELGIRQCIYTLQGERLPKVWA